MPDGVEAREGSLSYASEPSTYAGQLPAIEPGRYTLEVLVAADQSVTFGMVRRWLNAGR